MSRMFPKSPSLGALTHRAWTEERAGPRSWDWGTRCQQRRSGSLGHRPSTVPGGQQPHARAFLRKATPAAEPPSPRRRVCGCCRADSAPLSVSAQPPARGHRRRPEGQVRGRRGEWTGAEGTEEAEDDVGLVCRRRPVGAHVGSRRGCTRVWASHAPDRQVSPTEGARAPPCAGSLRTDPESVAGRAQGQRLQMTVGREWTESHCAPDGTVGKTESQDVMAPCVTRRAG